MALLDGKVVLVSGVGPGLGASTSRAVLNAGGRVVMADAVGDRVTQIRDQLDPSGDRTMAVPCDILSEVDCRAVAEAVKDRFGALHGVVNVAAVDNSAGGLMDNALGEWPRVHAVNVEGTLRLTRAVVPLMTESGGGSVVIIGSTAAVRPRRGQLRLAYAMSKAALGSATRYLAEELGADRIRVNIVSPGFKYGPVVEGFFSAEAQRQGVEISEVMSEYLDELALPDFATDDDVANTAAYFISDWSRSVTGQTLYVDGGFVME